jgi:mannose/cellobiose epimerase-like protein (N-acyl-D-glucosamine 2-epimerase family)
MNKNAFHGHFESILRYWERCRDRERGGFHHLIDSTGTVLPGPNRVILIQARLLYNYAEGIRAGFDFCRDPANHLCDFLTSSLRTPGGWYASLVDGKLSSPDGLDTYMNLFVVLAMARHAQATGRADVRDEAWRLFRLVEEKTIPGSLRTDGVLGCWGEGERGFPPMGKFAGNNVLHYLEALVCLRDAGLEAQLGRRVFDAREFFLARILDPKEFVTFDSFREGFHDPDRKPGAYTSLAHGLEWLGFFREWPGAELPEATERAILDKALHCAVQPDGHFTDQFFLTERRGAGHASFWTQSEAVKGFGLAARLFGEPYGDAFRRTADFYFTKFVDADGGVFSAVDRNGVAISRMKGHPYKADYHSLRMCVEGKRHETA